MDVTGKYKGEVVKYDVTKGFGFIKATHTLYEGKYTPLARPLDDFFGHWREIVEHSNGDDTAKLCLNEIVTFEGFRGEKGNQANEIRVIGTKYDEAGDKNYNSEEYHGKTTYA